ncbi:MAG: NAD(P)H-hydrate epimerase, partial [Rhodocyclaceae bacterium]|nr:NAD(P)H-hydrate epimerase [Rhodocyclaceae bacterium]
MNPHTALYTVEELRRLESLAAPACGAPLMERAGRAAAEFALRLTAHDAARPILIACGPGNNGGDGFVMARLLREAGRQVTVAFHGDVARLSEDARATYSAWWQAGGREVATLPAMPAEGWALAVDALFGIGLTRDIAEPWADWIARMNALPCPRLALDIPSGLFADTGCASATTFRATHTLTFLTHKPGCHTADGPDCCGQLQLATLDVDAPALLPAGAHLICRGRLGRALPARRANSHKGDYGTVALLGGARGMVGALWLAARAALMLG